MKAIRQSSSSVSLAILIAIALVLLASCEKVQAQNQNNTTTFTFPPIGTVQKVMNYAVRSVNVVILWTWTYDTNNQEHFYGAPVWYGSCANPLTNKFQLDQQIIATELTKLELFNSKYIGLDSLG
jgi:hypothetical protein